MNFDESFFASISPLRRMFFEAAVELGELRDTPSILNCVFRFIFKITPADRASISIDNSVWNWERGDLQPGMGTTNAAIETVLKNGETVFSQTSDRSMLCVPLVSSGNRLGAMYAESVDADNPLTRVHLFFLTATAAIAANAFRHSLFVEGLQAENSQLREALDFSREMVGNDPALKRVKEQIIKVAPTDATVLVQGESGAGKEVAARAVHQNSRRKDGPFIAVNCGAIIESLRESELFGHEKGAFTGAVAQRKGKIELAHGGTLFLDEVAELSMPAQAALLRVLQERKFERVGGTRTIEVDVRIITATNRNLETAVKEGRFRQDLFFRLQVVVIKMPSLAERPEDIIPLATHFIQKFSSIRRVSGIAPEAQLLLTSYKWPGNVRELENTMMSALVLGTGDVIGPDDLPEALTERKPVEAGSYHDQVNSAKRAIVLNALRQTGFNFYEFARLLNVHPTYLYRLAANLGVAPEQTR